jgi:hypothetical protein
MINGHNVGGVLKYVHHQFGLLLIGVSYEEKFGGKPSNGTTLQWNMTFDGL